MPDGSETVTYYYGTYQTLREKNIEVANKLGEGRGKNRYGMGIFKYGMKKMGKQ